MKKVKKMNYEEAIKSVSFIKGISKYKAKKWLESKNILEGEDVKIWMNGLELDAKLALVSD